MSGSGPAFDPAECMPPMRPMVAGGWDTEAALGETPKPIDFERFFGRPGPLEIEVGFGSGIFLATHAPKHPERNFLGIENAGAQMGRLKEKLRKRSVLNVRLVLCDALYVLEEFVPDASVDVYRIYFPDPWPKSRHHKRRVFSPRILPPLERTLKPGGRLYIKTDVTAYYEVIDELLRGVDFLRRDRDARLDVAPDPDDIVTNFQRKAMEKGHPIHALDLTRR
ncbi:MAG: tRNA (guanosine(46)-N7)-methyltransferase TrmB [Candidatus Sumerlaeia bacterium]|nr:tRNA (guanosine(46)-N7)-methyltransferase TrmB [Candidatus Sumerlaeia bacterium]